MSPARRRLLVAASLVALAIVGLALDPDGLRKAWALEEDLVRLETENAKVRGELESLRRQARALSSEPAAIERAAREEFGYVRPDEILFKLE